MKLSERIEKNLLDYLKARTHTGTELERNNEEFFNNWVESVPYFKEHPEYYGLHEIQNDHLKRKSTWALLRGKGKKTIIMIHHTDTVDVDDFGKYKKYAYDPYELERLYKQDDVEMEEVAKSDLYSGKWIFGRGASDMKGGGSITYSLLEQYSEDEEFNGNILVLGVPDEENLSAGMRSAIYLLKELKEKYDLEYVLMLNVEPHEKVKDENITVYDGSVGKIMPIFMVRGKLAHVGQIYKGFNPINLLSEIVRKTELNPDFIEKVGNTVTPAPTWLYFKDRKTVYDVSLPLTVGGYMSILTLTKSPKEILQQLKEISKEAFKNVIADMKASYEKYKDLSNMIYGGFDWKVNVKYYGEIYNEILEEKGDSFKNEISSYQRNIEEKIRKNEITRIDGAYELIEKTLEYYSDLSPLVVIALAPPYYPSTNNSMLENAENINKLIEEMGNYAKNEIGLGIYTQNYFTGISDLSYGLFTRDNENIDYIADNMMFWGDMYYIPLDIVRELSMPVLNVGPWGRDLHKYTERVYKKDLFENIPKLIDFIVKNIL
ncbi:MAG: M20/M25/M40 family metallo-hydrolase [Sedimentibacter sp.]